MMSLPFRLFTQVSGSGPLGPLVSCRNQLNFHDRSSEDISDHSSIIIRLNEQLRDTLVTMRSLSI